MFAAKKKKVFWLTDIWVNFSRLRQVCDAGVWTHQDVGRVQRAVHEATFRLRQVNATYN